MSIDTWTIPFEAYRGDEPFIFASYSHKDRTPVFEDLRTLYVHDFRLWYDEGIEPGKEWAKEIAHALNRCAVFLVFLSPNAVLSENVLDEIHFALNHRKRCYAAYLEDTNLPADLELRMNRIQALMRYRMDPKDYLTKLVDGLSSQDKQVMRIKDATPGLRIPSRLTAYELREAEQRIVLLHQAEKWAEIRSSGAVVAENLLEEAQRGPVDFDTAIRLMHLGVYLTDADSIVAARRCLDAAVRGLLNLGANQGESAHVMDHLGMAYNNVARLLRRHHPASRSAETFYRKSLEIFQLLYPTMSQERRLGDRLGMAYVNLGNSLAAQAKPEAARESYTAAVDLYRQLCDEAPGDKHMLRRLEDATMRAGN